MLSKVAVFHNLSDSIDCNSLFGCNCIYDCKSMICGNMNFKNRTEVDAVCRFTS